jgi:serine/threonine protein kinase
VILDFGVAKKMSNNALVSTQTGSPLFMAPEVLKGNGYDERVDMWSIGIIAYILLTGVHPCVPYSDTGELFQRILAGNFNYTSDEWLPLSPDAAKFVQKLLQVDPSARLTAKEAMQDEWIQTMVPQSYLEMLDQVNRDAALASDDIPKPPVRLRGATTSALPDYRAKPSPVRSRTMSDKLPGVLSIAVNKDLPNLLDGDGAQHRFRTLVRHMVNWSRLSKTDSTGSLSLLTSPLSAMTPLSPPSALPFSVESLGIQPSKAPQFENVEDWDKSGTSDEEAQEEKRISFQTSKQEWVAYEPDLSTSEQLENIFGY